MCRVTWGRLPLTWFVLCAALSAGFACRYATADSTSTHPGGIWKAAVPAHAMHGEFDNLDPLGLAAGARIVADCSLNWVSPDDGKLYCFASGTSLAYFLQSPNTRIRDAQAAWISLHAEAKP
jgi:hypothetical protein